MKRPSAKEYSTYSTATSSRHAGVSVAPRGPNSCRGDHMHSSRRMGRHLMTGMRPIWTHPGSTDGTIDPARGRMRWGPATRLVRWRRRGRVVWGSRGGSRDATNPRRGLHNVTLPISVTSATAAVSKRLAFRSPEHGTRRMVASASTSRTTSRDTSAPSSTLAISYTVLRESPGSRFTVE
jgi:hypothetical protein